MIERIKHYFDQLISESASGSSTVTEEVYRVAAAALMTEVIASDYKTQPEEEAALFNIVKQQFGLDDSEADQLLKQAKIANDESTDYFQFTSKINDFCSPEQKIALIESLWRVAFADKKLHHYEEHVIRRVADLIYVPHIDFISTKLRAQKECL